MNFNSIQKRLGLASFAFGGVILVSHSLSKPALAQVETLSCPGIFYSEPFTSRVAAPVGCPMTEYQKGLLNTQFADSIDGDQANRLEELRSVPIDDEIRESRLKALQQSVIVRDDGM